MATLKGQTIAASYQDLLKRADTYSQTGTNIELMNDSGVVQPTGLYLESGATTDFVGIGVADPDATLEILDTTTQLKLSYDATNYATFNIAADGLLTITTVDPDGAEADIILAPDGNVGISDSSPSYPLTIKGADGNAETLALVGDNNSTAFTFGVTGDNFYFKDKRADATRIFVEYTGDVTFTGDLIMADGKGIDFSAKTPDESGAGSMSNEILDDYEEGTWTPVLTDGSNDASMHGNTAGTYTKIGRQVTIWAYVQTSNLGSVSGAISIKGLPFSQASTDAHGAGTWGYGNSMAISAGTNITGMVGSSTAIMNIRHWDVAGGTSALQGSQWSSDADCSFTCSYIT